VALYQAPTGPYAVFLDTQAPSSTACACTASEQGPDGFTDLVLGFGNAELIAALELGGLPAGTIVELELTGSFDNGVPLRGTDCVTLLGN